MLGSVELPDAAPPRIDNWAKPSKPPPRGALSCCDIVYEIDVVDNEIGVEKIVYVPKLEHGRK